MAAADLDCYFPLLVVGGNFPYSANLAQNLTHIVREYAWDTGWVLKRIMKLSKWQRLLIPVRGRQILVEIYRETVWNEEA